MTDAPRYREPTGPRYREPTCVVSDPAPVPPEPEPETAPELKQPDTTTPQPDPDPVTASRDPEPRPRTRTDQVSLDQALLDPNLLGAALGDPRTWSTWLTVLRAASGLPLNQQQLETFKHIAGDRPPPGHRVQELWCVVGRSGGKSRTAAAIATASALLQKHHLAPGELGHILVLSPTVLQSRVIFSYARAFIEQSPILRHEIVEVTQSEIRLRNNILIATHPNSFRSVRGRTLCGCCIFDESSFWRDDSSANPDTETYRAVLPALIRSGGMLIGISTPYRKVGLLHQKHHDHFGVDDPDVLCVQGDSRSFNPTLSAAAIKKASDADPEAGLSEWQGIFRSDLSQFLSDADIDNCIDYSRPMELPPRNGIAARAFIDPSGGRGDAMTLCIGHVEEDRVVVDVIRGRAAPFDPASVVDEWSSVLRDWSLTEATGDAYSASWCESAFRERGIRYVRCISTACRSSPAAPW
jgi:hypothetical protein